ncbi:class I SAM-dependent methyltransferase [Thermococcus aggregans]|uniref:Class I SAM-dependent methyltransferase n=1 Tax=Thermococcus aggregans TaxID=110163 RepID=A0A9E7MYE1_THEAG|nr:class I SAM-dependent methyltransferase [Thermococcus aggregans]USS41059.1 class I SAM-dependent methyltransferase [Thermococcus aggregans]
MRIVDPNSIYRTVAKAKINRAMYLVDILRKNIPKDFKINRYLDAGGADGTNAYIFGRELNANEIWVLDIQRYQTQYDNVKYIVGDIRALPFENGYFDLVTAISVIEHVKERDKAIKECCRVLRPGGLLFIQIPNLKFPVDLHTGMFNPYLLPSPLRRRYVKAMGHEHWLEHVFKVSPGDIIKEAEAQGCNLVYTERIIYTEELIPNKLRAIYNLLKRLKVLDVMPLGFVLIFKKLEKCAGGN